MFWSQYRRTFVPVHALILLACLAFIFIGGASLHALVRPLVVMEAAAVFGASMAARFKASVDRAEHPVPDTLGGK